MSLGLRADVRIIETSDGAVLLDERDGRYWQLNRSGTVIVQAITEGLSDNAIGSRLRSFFGASGPDAARDVATFLDALSNAGLVQR